MRKHLAFTLVELLVIIAIIAILLSMMAPTLQRSIMQTEGVTCFNNMSQISTAWYQYAVDNDNWICGGWTRASWDWVNQSGYGNAYQSLANGALWKYIQRYETYRCPTDVSDHKWTYAVNAVLNGEHTRYRRLTQMGELTQTMAFMEEDDYRGYNMNSWMCHFYPSENWIDYVVGWHDKGANLGFCDGHAEHWIWQQEESYTVRSFGKHQPGPDLRRLQSVYYPEFVQVDD